MSYLGEEILRQLGTKDMSAALLSERTGFSASQISKWTRGEQTSINEVQLTALQRALSDDPESQSLLVLAHLLDEKFGLNQERVEVTISITGELNDQARPVRHQSKGERAFAWLNAERIKNPDLNDLGIDLARILGWVDTVKRPISSAPDVAAAADAATHDAAAGLEDAPPAAPAAPEKPTTYPGSTNE